MDTTCQLGSPQFVCFFFSLKCLVKPHRIGYLSSSQGCCSLFSTAIQLPALWFWGIAALFFLAWILPSLKKKKSWRKDLLYHALIRLYLRSDVFDTLVSPKVARNICTTGGMECKIGTRSSPVLLPRLLFHLFKASTQACSQLLRGFGGI